MNKVLLQRICLLIIAGLLGFGQLQKVYSFQIFFHEIFMMVFILLSYKEIVRQMSRLNKSTLCRYSCMFVAYLFVVTVLQFLWISPPLVFVGLLYGARLVLYGLFAATVYAQYQKKLFSQNELQFLILITTTILVLAGLLQYFFIPDLRLLRFAGWDDHYLRLTSTLLDPSFTGIILLLGSITAFYTLASNYSRKMVMILGIHLVALFLTYSRATYLAGLVWILALAIHMPSLRKLMSWLIIAGGIIIALLPRPASEGARLERFSSIRARYVNITSTLQSMKAQDWIIGKGWYLALADRELNNTVTTVSHSSSPDNSFLHVLQSLGVIGLVVFVRILRTVWKNITVQGQAVLLAVCVASLFSQVLFYPFLMILLPYTLFLQRKT